MPSLDDLETVTKYVVYTLQEKVAMMEHDSPACGATELIELIYSRGGSPVLFFSSPEEREHAISSRRDDILRAFPCFKPGMTYYHEEGLIGRLADYVFGHELTIVHELGVRELSSEQAQHILSRINLADFRNIDDIMNEIAEEAQKHYDAFQQHWASFRSPLTH